jgi:hypothetical protein
MFTFIYLHLSLWVSVTDNKGIPQKIIMDHTIGTVQVSTTLVYATTYRNKKYMCPVHYIQIIKTLNFGYRIIHGYPIKQKYYLIIHYMRKSTQAITV